MGLGLAWARAQLGSGTGELHFVIAIFVAPVEKFPGSFYTSATPLSVVRVEKFSGNAYIGAALTVESLGNWQWL